MAIELNKDSLEKALNNQGANPNPSPAASAAASQPQMPKEEEVGFHKGALNTLIAERNELVKMVQTVEAIMQAHIKRLEELGVKLQTQDQPKQ